jgi:flagellar protein FlbT
LRLRDAIHPDEAKTPVRRVCYSVQLVLSGDADPDEAHHQLLRHIEELSQVFTDADSRTYLDQATRSVIDGDYYRCLKALRSILPREERLLAAGA